MLTQRLNFQPFGWLKYWWQRLAHQRIPLQTPLSPQGLESYLGPENLHPSHYWTKALHTASRLLMIPEKTKRLSHHQLFLHSWSLMFWVRCSRNSPIEAWHMKSQLLGINNYHIVQKAVQMYLKVYPWIIRFLKTTATATILGYVDAGKLPFQNKAIFFQSRRTEFTFRIGLFLWFGIIASGGPFSDMNIKEVPTHHCPWGKLWSKSSAGVFNWENKYSVW